MRSLDSARPVVFPAAFRAVFPAAFRSVFPAAFMALGAILAGCSSHHATLPYYGDASLTPAWLAPDSRAVAALHRTGDFRLIDQQGQPFTSDSLTGRVHIAQFFFAECGDVCPTTSRLLTRVAGAFRGDDRVVIASYSVTPAQDSVPVLSAYAERYHIDARQWRLLTGDPTAVRGLSESYLVGLGRGSDYGVDSVAHTEMLVLVDQERHVRGVYSGTLPLDIQALIADVKTLLGSR
jgi:protein SCO1/2